MNGLFGTERPAIIAVRSMKKMRKNRQKAKCGQAAEVRRQTVTKARDGYTNPLAFLGDASPLFSSGTYKREGITSSPALLTALYRESWLAKRVIDMPSEDMTRAWYTLSPALPVSLAEGIRGLEARHEIRRELTNAIRWARLYGGACALIVLRGQEKELEEPLDPDRVMPGSFAGLLVRDRNNGVVPSGELQEDLDDPDFGYPKYYDFQLDESAGTARVHHSRVLRFTGRDLPRAEEQAEQYWGASELEHIWEELQKRNATSANIAQLVFQANVTTLKMSDFGETLAMGTEDQKQKIMDTIADQNRLRTSFGLQIMSAEDSYENHPYSFSGLSDIYEAFMLDMAGAAGIPATRLFGRSPQGMNATGESDLRNYYEMIGQMQERHLRPALEKLLPVMALSLTGDKPVRMDFSFGPLMTANQGEETKIRERNIAAFCDAVRGGLITVSEARERLRQMNIL